MANNKFSWKTGNLSLCVSFGAMAVAMSQPVSASSNADTLIPPVAEPLPLPPQIPVPLNLAREIAADILAQPDTTILILNAHRNALRLDGASDSQVQRIADILMSRVAEGVGTEELSSLLVSISATVMESAGEMAEVDAPDMGTIDREGSLIDSSAAWPVEPKQSCSASEGASR